MESTTTSVDPNDHDHLNWYIIVQLRIANLRKQRGYLQVSLTTVA